MRTIALLFLLASVARAQDSLVERLEAELRSLVQGADKAADGAIVRMPSGSAILVGTPPRVVAPYGDYVSVRLRLPDGREVTATRIDGDADLGIVVLKLPDLVAKGLAGVEVEGDWSRLGAGSIAIATDGRGRGGGKVGLVSSAEPKLGMIDAPMNGIAMFGSRGTLVGLRGDPPAGSCAACHQTAVSDYIDSRVMYATVLAQVRQAGDHPFWTNVRDPLGRGHGFRVASQDSDHLVAGPVIRRVLDDIDKHGSIQHGFLGVVVGDIPGEQAAQIATVVDGSPAFLAGLGPGMRVEALDGLPCPSAAFFSRFFALRSPGDEVTLRVSGEEIKVKLGDRATARVAVVGAETVGLTCVDLGDELRRFLGFPADLRGVVVQDVKPDSPAAMGGIQRGDVITAGGGGAIADLEELKAALAGARGAMELSGVRVDSRGNRSPTAWTAKLSIPEPGGR